VEDYCYEAGWHPRYTTISRTDQRLIEELQKDGRASYAELAAKLGIAHHQTTQISG
jgi:DNA-binding Lrp family transcriptional regulator